MDRKGRKRGIPLPAIIAASSALGSPRSSVETDPVANIRFVEVANVRAVLDDRLGVPGIVRRRRTRTDLR